MAFLNVPLLHTYRLLQSVNITFISTENPQAPFKSLSHGGLERNPRYLRGMPAWLVTVTENVTPGQPCGWKEGWRGSWRGCCEILPPALAVCLLPRCARAPVCICAHPLAPAGCCTCRPWAAWAAGLLVTWQPWVTHSVSTRSRGKVNIYFQMDDSCLQE